MTNEKTILKYQKDQSQWEEKGRTNSLESKKKGQGKPLTYGSRGEDGI